MQRYPQPSNTILQASDIIGDPTTPSSQLRLKGLKLEKFQMPIITTQAIPASTLINGILSLRNVAPTVYTMPSTTDILNAFKNSEGGALRTGMSFEVLVQNHWQSGTATFTSADVVMITNQEPLLPDKFVKWIFMVQSSDPLAPVINCMSIATP